MNIPDVNLLDLERKPVNLKSFEGKKTVIAFFPGAFTGGCTEELCNFQSDLKEFDGLGVQIVGIAVDSPFALTGWSEANDITFPLLSDYKRECMKLFEGYDIKLEHIESLLKIDKIKEKKVILTSKHKKEIQWINEVDGEGC